jgi:hypothetical protein
MDEVILITESVIGDLEMKTLVMMGFCESDNEPSISIRGRNFLTTRVTIDFSERTLLPGDS